MATDHIRWGPQGAVSKEKKQQFYKSVFVGGEEICLYDTVYVTPKPGDLPYIGKVMRLWDNVKTNEKKMRVRWFFRHQELPGSTMEFFPFPKNSKEVFISFGAAPGVENVNPVGVIERKCNVVCTSLDPRNRQPTLEELESADHFFDKTWDVKQNRLSADLSPIVSELGAIKVFNKPLAEKGKLPARPPRTSSDPPSLAPSHPAIRSSPLSFSSPTPSSVPNPQFPLPSSAQPPPSPSHAPNPRSHKPPPPPSSTAPPTSPSPNTAPSGGGGEGW